MFIKDCKGYELEKAKPNTSEDFFNKSEVSFVDEGTERTLTILYLRYFDELMSEFTPFEEEPIFQVGTRSVNFRDIVALVCLIKNPELRHRKKLYINTQEDFASYFENIDYEGLKGVFKGLGEGNGFELRSPLELLVQP